MKKSKKKIALITSIIAVSLLVTHLINKFVFYINTFKGHLFSRNSYYYKWRFGRIYYTKQGSGPALLLVHDLNNASSHYEWKEVVDHLAEDHTVYTIDLIGCGYSDKPKMTYTNYLYVQLLSDFIRDVIKEKTSIAATRYSCSIGIMACYIDSSLFKNLILINPKDIEVINKYPRRKHKIIRILLDVPIVGTMVYNIRNSRIALRKKFRKEYMSTATPSNRYIKAYSEAAHTCGANSKYIYTSINCHYVSTNIVHALKDIKNPITIIAGADCSNIDHVIEQYESINSEIQSIILFNTKELPQVEKPSQVATLISEYM